MASDQFALEEDWCTFLDNKPSSLKDVLERRVLVTHDTGQLEELRDDLDRVSSLLAYYLQFMMDKGMATPEEVCAIVNQTRGYRIKVAGDV